MRNKIEKAIRETLVVSNAQSIGIAADKILALINSNPKEDQQSIK